MSPACSSSHASVMPSLSVSAPVGISVVATKWLPPSSSVIHPTLAAHTWPLRMPVAKSMRGLPVASKFTQPIFAPHARPRSEPSARRFTPKSAPSSFW